MDPEQGGSPRKVSRITRYRVQANLEGEGRTTTTATTTVSPRTKEKPETRCQTERGRIEGGGSRKKEKE